ncbi:hypothetical protein ACH9EU_02700 [Kocuria sp. M1R5S2]|uniref:hypothetical protein n=1 Tax=Kocuria rhizosphaerae TaxID=3376285 RepID=UPI00378FDB66
MTIHDRGATRVLNATLAAVTARGHVRCNQDGPVPADPLLIVEDQEIPAVTGGESMESTGMMQKSFPVVEVEEQLGIDLEDEL